MLPIPQLVTPPLLGDRLLFSKVFHSSFDRHSSMLASRLEEVLQRRAVSAAESAPPDSSQDVSACYWPEPVTKRSKVGACVVG